MVKRKKHKKSNFLLWIILFLGIVAIILSYYGIQEATLGVGEVATGCNVVASGSLQNVYKCSVGECEVNGWKNCQSQTSEIQKVVFRTNAMSALDYDKTDTWIAVNALPSGFSGFTITNDLYGYCATSSVTNGVTGKIKNILYDREIYYSSSRLYIKTRSGAPSDTYRRYDPCLLADLNPTPKEPYSSKNQEMLESSSVKPFSCETPWTIEDKYGNLVDSGSAVYTGTTSGKYETGVKNLKAQQTFKFSGNINYAVIDSNLGCSVDTCNVNGELVKCESVSGNCKQKADPIACDEGEVCVSYPGGARCESPFEETVNLKTGYVMGEPIKMEYSLRSDSLSSATIGFKLYKLTNLNTPLESKITKSVTLPYSSDITFNGLDNPGTYKVVVTKSYESKTVSDTEYDFTVGQGLNLTMLAPISDVGTTLYVGVPIQAIVYVQEGGVDIENAEVSLKALIKPNVGSSKEIINIQREIINKKYVFTFQTSTPGILVLEATAVKQGVVSNTQIREQEVKPDKLIVKFTEDIKKITSIKPSTQTVKFTTKDASGNLVETKNNLIVKITPPKTASSSGDIDVTDTVTGSNGEYSFDYNFNKIGNYIISIIANIPGTEISGNEKSPSISVSDIGEVKECVSSDECPVGYFCVDYKCVEKEPPILMYILIGVGGLILIVLIFIIFKVISNRQTTNVNIGGGL